MGEDVVFLIYLGCVLLGLMLRSFLGFLNSKKRWSWKHFLISVLPSFIIMGYSVFGFEPLFSLQNAWMIVASSAGLSELQSRLLNAAGTSNATIVGKNSK